MLDIQKYKEGKLSEAELEQMSEALISAKLDRDKKREWAQILKDKYGVQEAPAPKSFWKGKSTLWGLMIAASVVLFASFFPFNQSPDLQEMVDQQISALSIMSDQSIFRKGAHEVDSMRKEATMAYANKQFEVSERLWEKVVGSEQEKPIDHFYLGLCQLQKSPSEPSQAVLSLQKSNASQGMKEEIAWVLSLAYLKAGETDHAVQELNKIVSQSAYKSAEAKKILAMIEIE
jgi:hypothetical protein